ncbi:MAG: RecX family transcriptional regulator [Kiloniellales bacterium]
MTDRAKRKSTRRRGPRKATPDYLRNAALYYLGRYESSAAHLRRLLLAKVDRSARFHGTERAAGAACVEGLIAGFLEGGLLDDARYAEGRALVLYRRGNSARAIRAGLALKGVDAELIEQALAKLAAQAADPELAAALAYARRRRLGPYRSPAARPAARERDLASLGRRGFAYALARRVIEARDTRELEAEAGLA